jgi:hypothetical protein
VYLIINNAVHKRPFFLFGRSVIPHAASSLGGDYKVIRDYAWKATVWQRSVPLFEAPVGLHSRGSPRKAQLVGWSHLPNSKQDSPHSNTLGTVRTREEVTDL